ncbi:trimeric intracellular cation channel family protein [Haliea sp. E17]|uniref:trimeric intracellular cation channel family protein n=1 Tax=Haliea sp. E17 TaxID=3401576 RepID=UPI003AABB4F4
MPEVIHLIDLVATGVFAISGALAAAERRHDILSFILFGTITGIGGGTARDLLLGTENVFWIAETAYLWICFGAAVATWFLAPLFRSLHRLLLWADAIGMALFSVLGAVKAVALGAPPVVCVVMGVMTATFGSMIRDTLLNQEPVLLGPEIYVTAALLGAASYTLLASYPATVLYALPVAILAAFCLRACAIIFDLRLPKYGEKNAAN